MATYAPSYSYPPIGYGQGDIPISPPTVGSGTATGMVPGPTPIPDVAGQLAAQIPGLGDIKSSLFGNLYAMSLGQIPQADQNSIQDKAAAQAAASGMPGTNAIPGTLLGNNSARNLGLLQYQLQQQAAQQYPSLVGAVSQTQTVPPALQEQIAQQNSVNAAAPNPGQAQSYAQQLYDQYLRADRGPGGGTGYQDLTGSPSSQRDMSWFYQPVGGSGTGSSTGQPIPLPSTGWDDMYNLDPETGSPYDMGF